MTNGPCGGFPIALLCAREETIHLALKPSPHYAKMAAVLRERGLEVEDDDCELIDMTIQECNRLLDLRSFLGR